MILKLLNFCFPVSLSVSRPLLSHRLAARDLKPSLRPGEMITRLDHKVKGKLPVELKEESDLVKAQ